MCVSVCDIPNKTLLKQNGNKTVIDVNKHRHNNNKKKTHLNIIITKAIGPISHYKNNNKKTCRKKTTTILFVYIFVFADTKRFSTSSFCSLSKNITFVLNITLALRARAISRTHVIFFFIVTARPRTKSLIVLHDIY